MTIKGNEANGYCVISADGEPLTDRYTTYDEALDALRIIERP